ncbi:hypothetical protein FRC17_006029 [Serendipita sp. 399]|nr:hypothetical protein FRC17_006029 [Serendipita sp. 399]
MPTLRGLTAHVVCDGKTLEEHLIRINPANEHEVSCWVASESEKAFEIECNWEMEEEWDWSIRTNYDEVLKSKKFRLHSAKSVKISEVLDNVSWRRMVFADITPQDLVEGTGTGASPGTIKVEFHRAKRQGSPRGPSKPHLPKEIGAVGEGKKCIGGHRVKLGETIGAYDPEKRENKPPTIRLDKHAYVTFKFLYRSKDVLQAMDILPPTEVPSQQREVRQPPESEVHSQVDTNVPLKRSASTEPSYMEIVDRERELEEELARVRATKRRKLEGSSNIKREASPILIKGTGSKGRSKQEAIVIESDED